MAGMMKAFNDWWRMRGKSRTDWAANMNSVHWAKSRPTCQVSSSRPDAMEESPTSKALTASAVVPMGRSQGRRRPKSDPEPGSWTGALGVGGKYWNTAAATARTDKPAA